MAAFRFRLDRVLEWYREQLQIEEGRLAECKAALNAVECEIQRLGEERQRVDRELLASHSLAARDLAALGRYRLGAKQRAARLEEGRRLRQAAHEEQRVKIQAARRRVRLLERLRERRLADHNYAEERALEAFAAEAFLAQWTTGETRHANFNSRN